jgi:hypothetical protein
MVFDELHFNQFIFNEKRIGARLFYRKINLCNAAAAMDQHMTGSVTMVQSYPMTPTVGV